MVGHRSAKFGGHSCSSSGEMFGVVKGEGFTCPRLGPSLLFTS